MDFKASNKKLCSTNIPYVRTHEGASEICKKNHASNFIFHYRVGFLSVLFSALTVGFFIMIVIYYNTQTDHYNESLHVEGNFPSSPWVSLDIDPETRSAVVQMASDTDVFIPNMMPFLQDEVAMDTTTRQKREIVNSQDCKSRQKQCRSVLKAVREITQTMSGQLEQLKNKLIEQRILNANDPQEVNYKRIYDCLQCANSIDHDDVDNTGFPSFDNQADDTRMSEVMPYFDNHHFDEDKDNDDVAHKSDERTQRGVTRQYLSSVTNSSKISGNAKITEILHNTTIVEKEQGTRGRGEGDAASESQVTRNMGNNNNNNNNNAATPIMIPTVDPNMLYNQQQQQQQQQQNPFGRPIDNSKANAESNQIPTGLHPFILPTAETTKYSQQIQFAPGMATPNQPLIPVCFYNSPPSGTPQPQPQQQQQQPFFIPTHAMSQGMSPGLLNQQIKYFSPAPTLAPTAQPMIPSLFQSSLPTQFFQSNSPATAQAMFPSMINPTTQPRPYYCTYIQPSSLMMPPSPSPSAPPPPQHQLFAPMPTTSSYQNPFVMRTNKEHAKEKVSATNNPMIATTAKSTYDESDEKYFFDVCDGYSCPPPYRKCLSINQRCDGRVDCVGAEDEIDCPIEKDSYYSRFIVDKPTDDDDDNDEETTDNYESSVVKDMTKTITTYIATSTYPPITVTPDSSNNEVVETTTFKMIVPEMPKHFKCKRIIQTVPLNKRCDGVFDCEDASDEEDCSCKDYLTLQRPFAVCDGHVDCSDGTDEQGCNFCRNDEYHCHRSGGCIPRHQVCNQATDCKLNEDELDCYVLSDGKNVNLDLDGRPHLNLAGVLTRYERGAWRPSCFKSEYRSENKRAAAAQKICEYLGFRSIDSVNEVIVQKSKLKERSSTSDHPINYEYPPQFTPMSRGNNDTCYGLYIRCKPILDKKVNVHLQLNSETNERSYVWPWEGSVFVDGNYRCPAVLLENDLLLASSKCAEHIDLRTNYTTAVFGVSSPDMPYNGPYQQTMQIVDVKPIKNSDATLFRLKDDINMTRYVQPIYLEKRIFPAAKNDSCVAIGVTEQGQRKIKFLQPAVDNCPKCHRCYIDKVETFCSKANETMNWSGNIVCLSGNGGWYPTAVFQDKDENCGFGNKQTLNSIDYIHAHLSEAIDEPRPSIEEPRCDGVRCAFGQCIPWNRVCDGIRDCRDGADENHDTCSEYNRRCEENISECKCSQAELRCGNGKCVPKEKFCDGRLDCEDGSDEPATCTCAEYLKLTRPKLVCDNRRHCLDKSDEDYRYCHCKDNSFKCHKSFMNGTVACVPPDVVCDGHHDCPEGEDEADLTCNTIKSGRFDPRGKGELQRRHYGEWQSACWPEPAKSQAEVQAVCKKMGYTTGLIIDGSKTTDSIYMPRNDFYMFQPNNHTWMTMREDKTFGSWVRPHSPCYKLYIHCF